MEEESYLSVPITENSTERFVIRDYRHGGLLGKLFWRSFPQWKQAFKRDTY